MARTGHKQRDARVSSIHFRIHRHPQGSHALPSQLAIQLDVDPGAISAFHGKPWGDLAAAVPRYGVDRWNPATALCRVSRRAHVAALLLAAAVPLAPGDLALQS